jgi:putative hemolysin
MRPGDLQTLAAVLLLLMGSAFFSAAEIALLSVNRYRLHQWLESGSRTARVTAGLLERPAVMLGTLLVTITALNYTAETVAARWALHRLGAALGDDIALGLSIVGISALVLVFAEMTPISYAAANADRVVVVAGPVVRFATIVLHLPVRFITVVANLVVRAAGVTPRPAAVIPTEEELKTIVDMEAEHGVLEEEEKELIHSIFAFGDKIAREVMVPRTDIVGIPRTGTIAEALRLAAAHRFSRLPVYEEDIDHIVGVVHIKDLLSPVQAGRLDDRVDAVMGRSFRVPETKRAAALLEEFRRHKRTFAIVLDEYGGTAGLVTIEDLLEELVGDIYDEYDLARPAVEPAGPGAFLVDGKLSIEEASELLGQPLPAGEDYDTLAGLLYSRLGAVPRAGQRVELDNVILVAERLEGTRIARVKVIKQAPPAGGDAAGRETGGG